MLKCEYGCGVNFGPKGKYFHVIPGCPEHGKLNLIPLESKFSNFDGIYNKLPNGAVFAYCEDYETNQYTYDPDYEMACDCWFVKTGTRHAWHKETEAPR